MPTSASSGDIILSAGRGRELYLRSHRQSVALETWQWPQIFFLDYLETTARGTAWIRVSLSCGSRLPRGSCAIVFTHLSLLFRERKHYGARCFSRLPTLFHIICPRTGYPKEAMWNFRKLRNIFLCLPKFKICNN